MIVLLISACDGSDFSEENQKKVQTEIQTETFILSISDIDKNDNVIAANVKESGGPVGITAFAQEDGHTISYVLVDDGLPTYGAFALDSETGIVTVADHHLIDSIATTEINFTLQAMSTSSSIGSAVFTVKVINSELSGIQDIDVTPNVIDDLSSVNGVPTGIKAVANHDGYTVEYSLLNTAGGRFSIDELSGEITVADHSLINRADNTQHVVEVLATSSNGDYVKHNFTIDVNYSLLTTVIDVNNSDNHIKEEAIENDLSVGIQAKAFHDDHTISYALTRGAEYGFKVDSKTGDVSIEDKDTLLSHIQTYYILEVTATSSSGATSASQFKLQLTPTPFMSFDFKDNKVENGFGNWNYSDIGDNECDVYGGESQSKLCGTDGSRFYPYYNPHNNAHIGWTRYGFFDSESTLSVAGSSMKVLMTGGIYEDSAGLLQESGVEVRSKSQYLENIDETDLFSDRDLDGRFYFYYKTKTNYTAIPELKGHNRLSMWTLMPPNHLDFDDYAKSKQSRPDFSIAFFPFIDSSVGGHYYHRAANIPMGGWTKVVMDAHPIHHNGGAHNPYSSFSEGGDVYSGDGQAYFDNMVTISIGVGTPGTKASPIAYYIDELTTYSMPYENEETISTLAIGFSPQSKRFDIGFSDKYRCGECYAEYEVRYSFFPIDNGNYEDAHLPELVVNFDRNLNNGNGIITKPHPGYNQIWAAFDIQESHRAMLTEGQTIFIAVKDKSERSEIEQQPADFELVQVPGVGEIQKMDLVKTIDYQIITPLFPLELKTKELSQGIVGQAFKQQIDIFGALPPYSVTSSQLPEGLTISKTGLLSGIPTVAGESEIEITIKSENETTLTSNFTMKINNKSDFDTLSCSVLVDFGDSLENSMIFDERFDVIIKDKYTNFVDKGTATTVGSNGSYNYQGVQSLESVELGAGVVIRVVWFNDSDKDILFSPKISLNDADRVSTEDGDTWHNFDELKISANSYGVSQFVLEDAVKTTVINVSNNLNVNSTLVLDKIELVEGVKPLTEICHYPFIDL